jgi:hypothetical protein
VVITVQKTHAGQYVVIEDDPDDGRITTGTILAVTNSQADAERIAAALKIAAVPEDKRAQFWREEFEHVRADRNAYIDRWRDANERVEQADLRAHRLNDLLLELLSSTLYVKLSAGRTTAHCNHCKEHVAGADVRKIAHAKGCPVPDAVVSTSYKGWEDAALHAWEGT